MKGGSPYQYSMPAHPTHLTYATCTLALLLEGLLSSRRTRRALKWLTRPALHWAERTAAPLVLVRWLYVLHQRRRLERLSWQYVNEGLTGELGDIIKSFHLRAIGDGTYAPTAPGGFWLADLQGETVGIVGMLRKDELTATVHRLNVTPRHQGCGIAAQLMDALTAHARAHGIRTLELATSPYNVSAISFYQRIGWKRTGYKNYLGIMLITMRLDLAI
ncbi:hypothetical protein H0H81_008618 [Sphagnurus paluster]|uniref:N-acetyltransferase domain-containing protein n=1 Tax=Sphagnurus paluster TaxID=117069 RepID=A0A9P7FWA6_9AGAR|nr:hypothetical protein H0H81_008618 [Sphagnurus paluster]